MIRTLSVWRWQLIFTGSVVAIVVMIAAFRPQTLGVPMVLSGLALVVLTTVATLVVPWHRIAREWVAVIPFLDALAVGLTTNAPDIRLGFLWVFPVTWLATYFTMPWVFAGIGFISVGLVAFANQSGTPADTMLRVIIVVLTLSFLGTTVRIGSQRSRAARRLLQRQSEQVNRAARRAETHQQRVTQIIDALDVALVAVAPDGTIQRTNDAYRELYGRDRYGASLPSTAVEYDDRRGEPLPPERTSLARAALGEVLDAERVWLFDREGRWRALEVSTQPLAGAGTGEHSTLVVIDDITAALEAAEERRMVTAIVSHELRNPLTAIIGHVDLLLERDDLPERVVSQLEVVMNASERMQNLVSSTIEQTRPDQGVLFEPVDLRQITEAAIASFAPVAARARQHLSVEGAETLSIYGDAFRLRQVVDNLLSNAVKYTPSGGAITATLGTADDSQAEIVIADTGTGMSADEVDRLFDPYFRADRAKRDAVPGTGLGMGIARDIVTAHGGCVEVQSTVGEGTRITLRFPRRAQKEAGQ